MPVRRPPSARAPRQLRPWRRHLREGLELADATGLWDVVDGYPEEEYQNTRFSLGTFEKATLKRLTRKTGKHRWVILTAALHHIAESDRHILQSPAGAAVAVKRSQISPKVPRPLWPWRSELEQGIQLADTGGDWNACDAYLKQEFAVTRIMVTEATRDKITAMAARRGVTREVVVTVALHTLAHEPAFVNQRAPESAIAQPWPPPLAAPGVRRRTGAKSS